MIKKIQRQFQRSVLKTRKAKLWGCLILFIIIVITAAWLDSIRFPSTDDAYIEANIVQISPQVSGPIQQLYVDNYQTVKKGQALLDIDPAPFEVIVNKAKAQLDLAKQNTAALENAVNAAEALVQQRQSELVLAEKQQKRILTVVHKGLATLSEGDRVISDLNVAKAALSAATQQLMQAKSQLGQIGGLNAQVRSAEAELAQAELDLQHTHISAPTDGYIVNLSARVGTMLSNGNVIFSIIDSNKWWADANFKETSLERIRSGQSATIVVDTYPNHEFHGVVENISRGSGAAFSIFPAENATGNWVKVTQRFTVRVLIKNPDRHFPLNVGASSVVTVDTTS